MEMIRLMQDSADPAARRPLKSRASAWAGWLSLPLGAACVVGAFLLDHMDVFFWALVVMVLGEIITVCMLLCGITAHLKGKP